MQKQPKLLDQLRHTIQLKQYSLRTEQTYVHWCKKYILYHNKRHPIEMGRVEIEQFLTHLATDENVAASTQDLALQAILFLYKNVLNTDIQNVNALRSKKPQRLPVVMSPSEVAKVIKAIDHPTHNLMTKILYGCGLRLIECVRLRVGDIDFGRNKVVVRRGKGDKDREVPLPTTLIIPFQDQIKLVEIQHKRDLSVNLGRVYLPHALQKKYPNDDRKLIWQYLFPAEYKSIDPRGDKNQRVRHHLHVTGLQKAIAKAVKETGINKRISAHTFRHSFATHQREAGVPLEDIQKLLGHKNIKTTTIYTRLANPPTPVSPLDGLDL